jgi:hypothetical protein
MVRAGVHSCTQVPRECQTLPMHMHGLTLTPLITCLQREVKLDQLPKSYMVSYKYHIGRLAVYEEDLQTAARELQQAFQLCKKEAQVRAGRLLVCCWPTQSVAQQRCCCIMLGAWQPRHMGVSRYVLRKHSGRCMPPYRPGAHLCLGQLYCHTS